MQIIALENRNRLYLDDPLITEEVESVKADLLSEGNEIPSDAAGIDLEDRVAVWDGASLRYYIEFTLASSSTTGFYSVYWHALDAAGNNINLSQQNTPQDIKVQSLKAANQSLLVIPVSAFLDSYLACESKLDDDFKSAISAYSRHALRSDILSSQGTIENKIKMKLFRSSDSIQRDYYAQEYRSEYWLQQTNYRPIISIDSYKLVYGGQNVEVTNDLSKLMAVDKMMGTIEFVPTQSMGQMFTVLSNALSALTLTLVNVNTSRVPLLFRIEYTHGLDFPRLPDAKKESIRQAVARNVLINLLPRIDPLVRKPSESLSIDGASRSTSGGLQNILRDYQEQEKDWIKEIMREYGTHYDIAVL